GHEKGAPEHESAEKDLAQLRVGHHETASPVGWDLENAARAARSGSNNRRLTGNKIDVSGKIAGSVHRDGSFGVGKDLDLPREHNHERTIGRAWLEQNLAGFEGSLAPERRDPLDLHLRQNRIDVFLGYARSGRLQTHVSDLLEGGPATVS